MRWLLGADGQQLEVHKRRRGLIIPATGGSNQGDGMRIIFVLTTGVAIVLAARGAFRSQPHHPPLRRVLSHTFGRRTGFTNNLLPPVQRGGTTSRKPTLSAHRKPMTRLCARRVLRPLWRDRVNTLLPATRSCT